MGGRRGDGMCRGRGGWFDPRERGLWRGLEEVCVS